MKKNGVKNLKVIAASLCLSATLLTGCGNNVSIGNSEIVYDTENNKTSGNVTFEDLNKYGKVVILEDNGETFSRLVLKQEWKYSSENASLSYNCTEYIDLETGAKLISYKDHLVSEEREWQTGENLKVISEVGIISYLVNGDFVKTNYNVEELMGFFKESVVPNLENCKKELIK